MGGGWEPEQDEDGEAEQCGEQRHADGQSANIGDPAAVVAVQDVPGAEEGDGFGQAVPGHVQQEGREGGAGADGGGQGDQAHVFHGCVGQHPLVVALPDQQHGGEGEGGQGQDQQQGTQVAGTERGSAMALTRSTA